jgi:hypothetical protein
MIAILVVALLFAGIVPPANALTDTGSVSGKVTGVQGVDPATSGSVEIYSGDSSYPSSSSFLGGDGSYTFQGLQPGSYKVKFDSGSSGGLTQWYGGVSRQTATPIMVAAGQAITGIDATLAKGGSIGGHFTLPPGAENDAFNYSISIVTADSNTAISHGSISYGGNGTNVHEFSIPGVPAGSYKLRFNGGSSGAADQWYGSADSFGTAKTITVASGQDISGIDLVLTGGGTISGKATLPPRADLPDTDVSQVTVLAFPAGQAPGPLDPPFRTASINADGSYQVKGLGAGSYKLKFASNVANFGLIEKWNGGADSFGSAPPINVALGQRTNAVDVALAQLATVSGRVAIPAGADIAKIAVSLSNADPTKPAYSESAQIGADGTYKFTNVPAGDYKVHYYDNSNFTLAHWYGGTDNPDTAKVVKVAPSQAVSGIDSTLVKSGSFSGRITGPHGTDLSGTFDIYRNDAAQTWSGRGRVRADGTYSFPSLPAGSYKVSFWVSTFRDLWYKNASSFDSATPVTVVDAQDTAGLNFDLPAAPAFTDVAPGTQFSTEIMWMADVGISTGWTETGGSKYFRPLSSVNRDAMAAFMYRLAGKPEFTPPAVSPFADVATNNQFYKEITWLASKKISTGWQEGNGTSTFRPLQPVNRDAMAAFLYRLAAKPTFTTSAAFQDVAGDNQFHKEISWLASEGISTGWDEGNGTKSFRPVQAVNRDAMAAFMYRFNMKYSAVR